MMDKMISKIRWALYFVLVMIQTSFLPSLHGAMFNFDRMADNCCIPLDNNCCDSWLTSTNGFTSFVPVVVIEAVFGETVGCNDDYAKIGTQIYTAFGPNPSASIVTTFNAYVLNDHGTCSFASNIGFGVRSSDWQSCATKGVHLFIDTRQKHRHNFQSLGLSFEYLTNCYSLRLNGYLPVGKFEHTHSRRLFEFDDGFCARCTSKDISLQGFDASIEIPLIGSKCWEFSVLGGAYYFKHKCINTEAGGLAVARVCWNEALCLEGRYTYDREFGSRGQGVICLNIPLMGKFGDCNTCECYTRQLVRRFDIIPIGECCCWKTNFSKPR